VTRHDEIRLRSILGHFGVIDIKRHFKFSYFRCKKTQFILHRRSKYLILKEVGVDGIRGKLIEKMTTIVW